MIESLRALFAPGPVFGWLCLAFLAAIPLVWIRTRRARPLPTLRFSSVAGLRQLNPTWAARLRLLVPGLRTLAMLALIFALARPQAGGEYRDTSEGIAIQMVLDISGSMAEQDFLLEGRPARRLDAVKRVFEDFVLGRGAVGGRENDLIGMTTFAMYADTPCPLTLDHGSLTDLLRQTEIPGWVEGRQVRQTEEAGFTSLGDGIVLATDDLRRAGEQAVAGVPGAEPAKSRVMILLTDGADNPPPQAKRTAPNPVDAAKVAATLGIRIYSIGAVGDTPAQRSPLDFFARSRAEVDEPTLRAIAAATGAKYFRATDVGTLRTIYEEIDRLERVRTGERAFRDNVWAAKIAMLAGIGLLMMEQLLVNTRFRKLP
ncbi:MAG: VWA domain-containing protein [Planctomycetes bacterium]|nr:VWA domain-containing protein [Planctomycetota bacterium]